MDRIIGIGEYAISEHTNDILRTFALSSCVALTAYSPVKRVMGMVHIALPSSQIWQSSKLSPAYYADTAVAMLINKICMLYGCAKGELELRLFGGAQSMRKDDIFRIGNLNIEMVETILRRMGLKLCFSDLRGNMSRSLEANVATGEVKVVYHALII